MAAGKLRHSWEKALAEAKSWEESEQTGSPEEGESEPENNPGKELFQYLLKQHSQGSLNAKQVCIIAHWASQAGVRELQPIALPPDTVGSGDFKRLLDRFLQKDTPDTYILEAPAFIRAMNGKGVYSFHCMLPHEGLMQELENADLAGLEASWDPPPHYSRHPVVQLVDRETDHLLRHPQEVTLQVFLPRVGHTVQSLSVASMVPASPGRWQTPRFQARRDSVG